LIQEELPKEEKQLFVRYDCLSPSWLIDCSMKCENRM